MPPYNYFIAFEVADPVSGGNGVSNAFIQTFEALNSLPLLRELEAKIRQDILLQCNAPRIPESHDN